MESQQVIKLIEEAFPLGPLPDVSLHQAQLADQSMSREISEEEWQEAGRIDEGRTWRELTDEQLMACDAALAHFDDASFVYHLPAYVLFALRHHSVEWPHPAWSLFGSVVFFTTSRTPSMLGRYKRLSPLQRAAVICFLEFIAEHGSGSNASYAEKALSRYWKTDAATQPLIVTPRA